MFRVSKSDFIPALALQSETPKPTRNVSPRVCGPLETTRAGKRAPSSEWEASVSARLIRNIDFTPEGVQAKIERVGAQERSCCYSSDTPLEHCPRTTLSVKGRCL